MEGHTSLLLLTYISRFHNAVSSLVIISTQVPSLQAEKKRAFSLQTHLWDEIATLTTKSGAQSAGKAHQTKFGLCVITGVT